MPVRNHRWISICSNLQAIPTEVLSWAVSLRVLSSTLHKLVSWRVSNRRALIFFSWPLSANTRISFSRARHAGRNLYWPLLLGNSMGAHIKGSAHIPTPGHRSKEQWNALNCAFSSPSLTSSRTQLGKTKRAMHLLCPGFITCMNPFASL